MLGLRYEGLRELAQALRTVNLELYGAVLKGLDSAGRIVRDDARVRFESWGVSRPGVNHAAEGFQVLVRPNTSTMAIVSVGQTLRRSGDMKRRRSNFGGLMMTKALLPARDAKMGAVVAEIDGSVTTLLHSRGL